MSISKTYPSDKYTLKNVNSNSSRLDISMEYVDIVVDGTLALFTVLTGMKVVLGYYLTQTSGGSTAANNVPITSNSTLAITPPADPSTDTRGTFTINIFQSVNVTTGTPGTIVPSAPASSASYRVVIFGLSY